MQVFPQKSDVTFAIHLHWALSDSDSIAFLICNLEKNLDMF